MKNMVKAISLILIQALVLSKGLDNTLVKPKVRLGALPFDFFIYEEAPDDLGVHRYIPIFKKKRSHKANRYAPLINQGNTRGILYSCNAGFIDFAHMQEGIDFGAYYVKKVEDAYNAGKLYFEDQTVPENSIFKITLEYPKNWQELSAAEKKLKIKELSIKLGLYIAHIKLTWHEIVTWHGWSSTFFKYLEQTSSFSYEDAVSNILGLEIAREAIENESLGFDDAATQVINRMFNPISGELRRLVKSDTKYAQSLVENIWYRKQSIRSYNKNRELNGKEKHKLPLIYGIGSYVLRMTNVGLQGKPVVPLLIENMDKCPGAKAKEFIVPGSLELAQGGDLEGLLNIDINLNMKRSEIILNSISKESNDIVNVRDDFQSLIDVIEDEMKYVFDEDIITN